MRVGIPGDQIKKTGGSGIPHIARHKTDVRCSAFSAVPKGQNRVKDPVRLQDANPG